MKKNFPIIYKVVLEEDHRIVVGEIIRKNEKEAITKINSNNNDAPAMFILAKQMGKTELNEKLTSAFLKDRIIDPGYQGLYLYLKEKKLPCWDLWALIETDKGICNKDKYAIYEESELIKESQNEKNEEMEHVI